MYGVQNLLSHPLSTAIGIGIAKPAATKSKTQNTRAQHTIGRTRFITFVILVHRWKLCEKGIPQKQESTDKRIEWQQKKNTTRQKKKKK